ncbi:MAG TPA: SMP-30/gluconolactonase/LRE family protein [Chryseosolibacter sp.]|nr:SMP-30/gluconolactonase/LRE family protein [Chryseosolibacter sp.]
MRHTFSIILSLACLSLWAQRKGEVVFTLQEKDLIPEGITYDAAEKAFYVGSIQKQKVLKITGDGNVSDFIKPGQDSLLQVLGMNIDREGRLWVCNNSADYDSVNLRANIHIYDLKSGKLIRKHTIRDGKRHLFNDLCFTAAGDAYTTDSDGGALYRIRNGVLEEFIKGGTFRYPNGITISPDEKKLLVSSGGLGIVGVDIETREVKPLRHDKYYVIGTDGLYRYKRVLIGVQNIIFPEAIIKFILDDNVTKIQDIDFVLSDHDSFDIPTTGVIVGDTFYFIANSQLRQVTGNKGKIRDPEKLTSPVIMKIRLN